MYFCRDYFDRNMTKKQSVAIVGGGTAGIIAACFLNTDKYDVTIYDRNKVLGRKFLVAGDGGFNLTHSEDIANLKNRYTPTSFLDECLQHFTNEDFRNWLKQIGIETFVGSSKRIYPVKGIKPIQVLNAITDLLKEKGVQLKLEHELVPEALIPEKNTQTLNFETPDGTTVIVNADKIIFALGGSSWKVTGSDGKWVNLFADSNKQKTIKAFQASNCAFKVDWDKEFIAKHEGAALKNIAITCGDKTQKGEAVITKFGIEGNAIYGLSKVIQTELSANNTATVYVDFKPFSITEKIHKLL